MSVDGVCLQEDFAKQLFEFPSESLKSLWNEAHSVRTRYVFGEIHKI